MSLASTCKALYYTTLISPAAAYGFRSRCLCALDQRYPKPLSEPSSRQTSHPSYETAINLYKSLHCPSWRALYYIFCQFGTLASLYRFSTEGNARGGIGKLILRDDAAQFQIVTRIGDIESNGRLMWSSNSNFILNIHVFFVNGLPRKMICISCETTPRFFEVRSLRRSSNSHFQWSVILSEILENVLASLQESASTHLTRASFATWLFSLPKALDESRDERAPKVFALETLLATNNIPESVKEEVLCCLPGLYWANYGAHGKELLHVSIEESAIEGPASTISDEKREEEEVEEGDDRCFIEPRSFFSNDFSISCNEAYECLAASCWPPSIIAENGSPLSSKRLQSSFIDNFPLSVVSTYAIDEDKDDDELHNSSSLSISSTKRTQLIIKHEQLLPFLPPSNLRSVGRRSEATRRSSEIACDPYSSTFFLPHGSRVLQRICPGLRLVARKVTGDVNVPSGAFSFVSNISSRQNDMLLERRSDPVYVFNNRSLPSVYNLSQQPVLSIFNGVGFINYLPSNYSPQEMRGSLYVFESSSTIFSQSDQERYKIAFLWEDADDLQHLTVLNRLY